MKKTYINPVMDIVKIQNTTPLMAGSVFARDDDFGGASGNSGDNGIGSADGRGTDYDW